MARILGKRRTREHVIADLSVNFVERQALLCGYTAERVSRDYGIDLVINTFKQTGEIEPGSILVQLKATDGLALRAKQIFIPFRLERADLVLWLSEMMPVILVIFDAKKTKAYWLCVQEYFEELKDFNLFTAGKTITVHVPVANRVNLRAMRRVAMLRDQFRKRTRSHPT